MDQIFTTEIQKAVRFAIRTHEGYQKQKRKGKDLPYITHPLIVGMLLSRAGAPQSVIMAGILHDTIEDSPPHKRVTRAMLEERFGSEVAELVDSVTEQDKASSWEDRKADALAHIRTFTSGAVLVKSADVVSNLAETIADFEKEGDAAFAKFNAPKQRVLENYLNVIDALLERMPENPFIGDFDAIRRGIEKM